MKKILPILMLLTLFIVSCSTETESELYPQISLTEYKQITLSDTKVPDGAYGSSTDLINNMFPTDTIDDIKSDFVSTLRELRDVADEIEDFSSNRRASFVSIESMSIEVDPVVFLDITGVEDGSDYSYDDSSFLGSTDKYNLELAHYQDIYYALEEATIEGFTHYYEDGTSTRFSINPENEEHDSFYYSLYMNLIDNYDIDDTYTIFENMYHESFGFVRMNTESDPDQVIQVVGTISIKSISSAEGIEDSNEFLWNLIEQYYFSLSDGFVTEDDWNDMVSEIYGDGTTEVLTITVTVADRGNIIKSYTIHDWEALQFLISPVM